MAVTAPITTARLGLIALLNTEFRPDGAEAVGDRLHSAVGKDGRIRIGVSPQQEVPMPSDKNTLQFGMLVQYYGGWEARVDPQQTVDPTRAETTAERFKRALRGHDPKTSSVWFYSLVDLTYPTDPTGNITRWEARVTAYGPNSSTLPVLG
jgi:hypothetical protein